MAEKVTLMVIKVDLQCPRCYKKIKKVLCRYPQIRDQVFDEKHNTVAITVVCCSPERIKEKISYRGGDTIKGIEIKVPAKPKAPEPEKKKESEKPKAPEPEKKKETEKPKAQEPEKPKDKPKEVPVADQQKPPPAKAPEQQPVKVQATAQAQAPVLFPLPGYPPGYQIIGVPCYEGHAGGPSYHGYGPYGGPPPSSCYGRPVYDSWGGGESREYYGNRFGYVCEENPSVCAIM